MKHPANEQPGTNVQPEESLSVKERVAKRLKSDRETDDDNLYINCDFILGSAAEVERLWSIAKNVLTDGRSCLHPIQFEALMFLRMNREWWDKKDVAAAIRRAHKDASEKHRARFGATDADLEGDVID